MDPDLDPLLSLPMKPDPLSSSSRENVGTSNHMYKRINRGVGKRDQDKGEGH